ncbi:hypothetical protein V6N13_040056 [Hibiscus sabdariffa]
MNLRGLDLSYSSIKRLQRTVSCLKHARLTFLTDYLVALIQLQKFPIFIVSNEIDKFKQLSRLQLRSELKIRNLENVKHERLEKHS